MQEFKKEIALAWVTGISLIFPLFFQLSGHIYNSAEAIVDSGGVLKTLPLPVSVLSCFGGILMLASRYRRALPALATLGGMFAAMGISLLLAGNELDIEWRKILLMAQVMLPAFGLALGQMTADEDKIIPKAFLSVLLLIVPCQLLASWARGNIALTHNLYLFSIYQHFQYVPLILVCAFSFAMVSLWNSRRKAFYFLAPIMGAYAFASLSLLTMFALSSFMVIFALSKLKIRKERGQASAIAAATLACMLIYNAAFHAIVPKGYTPEGTGQYSSKIVHIENGQTPENLTERFGDWKRYGAGIIETPKTILLGHTAPFPRKVRTSPHNWYIDMAYNFGIISWLPALLLLAWTIRLLWRGRSTLPPETLWLGAIVLYLVVLDSNFKVTLREPYPGIFAYFLWGLLLSRLSGQRSVSIAGDL